MSATSLQLEGITSAHVDEAWSLVEPWVKRATDQGPHFAPEDIREACKLRDMSLWALVTDQGEVCGALVTSVVIYPRVKACRLVLASAADGLRKRWLGLLPYVEAWGRSYGCELMEFTGREGWARLVPHARRYTQAEWRL